MSWMPPTRPGLRSRRSARWISRASPARSRSIPRGAPRRRRQGRRRYSRGVAARLLRLLTVAVALAALAHPAAWAAPAPIFTRVQDGPVLQPTTGFFDDYMVASPSVVRHEGRYHMVYTGHCSKPAGYTPILPPSLTCPEDAGIFLLGATSDDGVH